VPIGDPLSYVPNPSVAPCTGTAYPPITVAGTYTVPGGSCYNVTISGSNINATLNPGNYGSVSIDGTNNNVTFGPGQYQYILNNSSGNAVFNPGLYTLRGPGGVALNGSGTATGTGVTFYLGPSAGGLTVNGGTSANLSAPTSGTYAGILFFQDPGDQNAAVLNGTNNTILNGALYFPKAQVTMNGSNSLSSAYTILVASNLVFNGSVTFNNDYSSLPNGTSPIKTAVLVE
jgi:hypothetical protein